MADYTREISNSSGTLPADTGESAPPSGGGGSAVKTISSQSDISSYTPSLGDILHVTIPTAVGATLDFSALSLEGITIVVEDQTQASSSNYGNLIFGDLTSTSISMKSNGTNIQLTGNLETVNLISSGSLECNNLAIKNWKNSDIKCSNFILDAIVEIYLNNVNITTASLEQTSNYPPGLNFILVQNNNLDIGYLVSSMQHAIALHTTGAMFGGGPAENSSRIILKKEITGRILRVEDMAGYMGYNNSGAVEIIGEAYQRNI